MVQRLCRYTEQCPVATAAQHTVLFRRLGERQLHGATVGVVTLAHAALVLLLVGAHLLVAADVLRAKDREPIKRARPPA